MKGTRGARGTYKSHRTLQEPNLYPFVLAQIFAVFDEKCCANIYGNIRVAKNSASLIFLQIFFAHFGANICGNKCGAKNTVNICYFVCVFCSATLNYNALTKFN